MPHNIKRSAIASGCRKNAFHVGWDEATGVMAVSMETKRKNIGTRCRGDAGVWPLVCGVRCGGAARDSG